MHPGVLIPLLISELLEAVFFLWREDMPCIGGSLRQCFFDNRAWWAPDAFAFLGMLLGIFAAEDNEWVTGAGRPKGVNFTALLGMVGLEAAFR